MPKILVTEERLEDIIMLIKTWEGKLTWELLCHKVSELLNVKNIDHFQRGEAAHGLGRMQWRR